MRLFIFILFFILITIQTKAHCPLCTFGAVAAAGSAKLLGLSNSAIGVFLGAFSVATGLWFANIIINKKLMKNNIIKPFLVLLSYLLTILPLTSVLSDKKPLFVFLFGEYGTVFNRTYLLDIFIVNTLVGGLIVILTPSLSAWITNVRNKHMPFQGIILTFVLLIVAALLFQLL